jgi:rfaE bifunctional protein nucleotidyltransferase chain/domain
MPVLTLEQARAQRPTARTLVLTNGVFDLLHVGHLAYLEQARTLGDALWVGVNGDDGARRLKGVGRPLVPAAERARLIAALRPVDAVILFEEDTAEALIAALQPEIYVKGGDYAPTAASAPKPLPERSAVEAYGGRVVLIDYLPGHSTSALIDTIQRLPR